MVEGIITAPRTHSGTGRGFGQLFGLDPRIALLTLVIDTMLFGVEGVTLGASVIFLSIPAGIALAFIAYRAQMKWYGDDRDSAFIKACILGLLTAIPTDIPALLYVPSGVLGLVHNVLAKKQIGVFPARQ